MQVTAFPFGVASQIEKYSAQKFKVSFIPFSFSFSFLFFFSC